jgi:hypothetical protein
VIGNPYSAIETVLHQIKFLANVPDSISMSVPASVSVSFSESVSVIISISVFVSVSMSVQFQYSAIHIYVQHCNYSLNAKAHTR